MVSMVLGWPGTPFYCCYLFIKNKKVNVIFLRTIYELKSQLIEQVGGWTEVYEGLTFATVRGAGHEVPLFQPMRAFLLFRSFLGGKQLPSSSEN